MTCLRGFGRFPQFTRIHGEITDLDALFAHGLDRHLDGLAIAIEPLATRKYTRS
jgi:hypothetical protein